MIKKSDFVKHLSQLNFKELYLLLKQKDRWSNIPTDDFFFRFVVALKPIIDKGIKELYHIPAVCKGEGCGNFCERGIIFYRLMANRTNTPLEERLVTDELEAKFNEDADEEDYYSINVLNLVLEGPLDVLDDIAFCRSMDFSSLIKTNREFFVMENFHPHIYDSEGPDWEPRSKYMFSDPTLMERFASRLRNLDSRILTKEFIERMNLERERYLEKYYYRDHRDRSVNGFLKFHEKAMVIQQVIQMEEKRSAIMDAYHAIDPTDETTRMQWLENIHKDLIRLIQGINNMSTGPDNHFDEHTIKFYKQDFWFMTNYSHFCFDMRPYRKVFDFILFFEKEFEDFMSQYRIMDFETYLKEYQATLSWDSPKLHFLYFLANSDDLSDMPSLKLP